MDDKQLKQTLITLLVNAYNDAINEYKNLEILDIPSATHNYIEFQYYYNKSFNRVYLEFELSQSIRDQYPYERIIAKIHSYINSNFYNYTGIYPEIIAYDDGVNERYDSDNITTCIVGYWKCLHKNYEWIYSHQMFTHYMNLINLHYSYSKECIAELDKNYAENYTSNFEKYCIELNRIRNKYKVDMDKKPAKKFEDFKIQVMNLLNKYKYNSLSNEDREKYITEYMETKGDPEKVKALNTKYNINGNLNQRIPKIFEEYRVIFKDFFGFELEPKSIEASKHLVYIKILKTGNGYSIMD